jgi:hypothetical protein
MAAATTRTEVWQARIGHDLAAKLREDAELLGLSGRTDIVRQALMLLHQRAAEERMARSVDEFYGTEAPPLPAGVRTRSGTASPASSSVWLMPAAEAMRGESGTSTLRSSGSTPPSFRLPVPVVQNSLTSRSLRTFVSRAIRSRTWTSLPCRPIARLDLLSQRGRLNLAELERIESQLRTSLGL